jgi:hypothetical protein
MLNSWREAGRIAGIVIAAAIGMVGLAFVSAGISATLAWLPWIALGAAIVAGIYGVFKAIEYLWNNGGALIDAFIITIRNWANAALTLGSNFVNNLWSGVESRWQSFKDWIAEKWKGIVDIFGGLVRFGVDVATTPLQIVSDATMGTKFLESNTMYRTYKEIAPAVMQAKAASEGSTRTIIEQPVKYEPTIQLHIDSKPIRTRINNMNNDDAALEH